MTDNQIEKIEAFLSGKMEAEEQENFERELETDIALAAAFNTYVAIETDMFNKKEYASETDLKTSLTKLNANFFDTSANENTIAENREQPVAFKIISKQTIPSKPPYLKTLQKWKLVAAIFLGVLAIGTLYVVIRKKDTTAQVAIIIKKPFDSLAKNNNNDSIKQHNTSPNLVLKDTQNSKKPAGITIKQQQLLFAKYFSPDSAPTNKEGPLEDAFIQYEQKQYTNAAAAFEEADLTTRGEETDIGLTTFYAFYYKALSNIAIGKYDTAVRQLKKISTSNPLLKTKVQWYLALTYLKIGNIKNATSLLQAILESNKAVTYKLKADELLKVLEEDK